MRSFDRKVDVHAPSSWIVSFLGGTSADIDSILVALEVEDAIGDIEVTEPVTLEGDEEVCDSGFFCWIFWSCEGAESDLEVTVAMSCWDVISD